VCKRRAQVRKCVGKTKKLKKLRAKLAGKKAPVSGKLSPRVGLTEWTTSVPGLPGPPRAGT
jgi:hypothetical protein